MTVLSVLLVTMTNPVLACPPGNAVIGGVTCIDQSVLVFPGKIIVERIQVVSNGVTVELSTSGFSIPQSTIRFSSNVIIDGELTVRSTKQKAIYLPEGGIHLDGSSGNTAAGLMVSKSIKTSTITMSGSAMLWENAEGVVKATMTSTSLDIGEIRSKVKSSFGGAGIPNDSDCDQASEHGTMYMSSSPGRLYFCEFPGSGWRYTTLSP